jgi:Protein of unknown function (DUF1615)
MISRMPFRVAICLSLLVFASCALERPPAAVGPALSPEQARALIDESLPKGVSDRGGWVNDIYAGFAVQDLAPTRESVCAVVAVIGQESNFHVDPVIPGLGAIAWREIDNHAQRAGVPRLLVHGALELKSANGKTYSERIDAARTEKDLSDIYEDFIASVPLGSRLFANLNPIRTRGPMQVNVAFATQYAATRPYPYSLKGSVSDELFTRRGSLYFGIAHLLAYQPPYDEYLFRFADFNAGQFASRNAAFQNAVSRSSGIPVTADGALLPGKVAETGVGETELALRALAPRLHVDEREIHAALEAARSRDLQRTEVYERVFALAERGARQPMPRAVIPVIKLQGPKISRRLTTSWYAHRVEGRFEQCLGR